MSRTRAAPWRSPTRSARWSARRRSDFAASLAGGGKRCRSDLSAEEVFELAEEGEILNRLVPELLAERSEMLLLGEVERDEIGLGGRRGPERLDDVGEPALGIGRDRRPVLVALDVGRHGVFAEEVADLALAEAAPAEKIEMEESEERACRELLAELVIAEAGAGNAVEEHGAEIERELAVLVAHHGAAVTDHSDRLAELTHDRGEDQRRIVADVGRLLAGRQLLRHGLGDLVEGIGEERLAMKRAATHIVIVLG